MDIARIEACLARGSPAAALPRGDNDLNPGMSPTRTPLIPAAILIALVLRDGALRVILTRRTSHMRDHGGQIAFPGGRADPGDTDPVDTALRETAEEVNLPRDRVRVLGRLPSYVTRTGYVVTPIVGEVRGPVDLRPEPFEVEEIFEVPLAFLLDRANHQRHARDIAGVRREFYAMPYGPYYIWGATAGMIVSLVDLLESSDDIERA